MRQVVLVAGMVLTGACVPSAPELRVLEVLAPGLGWVGSAWAPDWQLEGGVTPRAVLLLEFDQLMDWEASADDIRLLDPAGEPWPIQVGPARWGSRGLDVRPEGSLVAGDTMVLELDETVQAWSGKRMQAPVTIELVVTDPEGLTPGVTATPL